MDIIQYNGVHKFVGVLDNPRIWRLFLARTSGWDMVRLKRKVSYARGVPPGGLQREGGGGGVAQGDVEVPN